MDSYVMTREVGRFGESVMLPLVNPVVFMAPSTTPSPLSAETAPQRGPSPALAESQHSKEVSSFSSSASSPWDSPENPFQALKPAPARAQSAPITLPAEPLDPVRSPGASSPPKSGDGLSSACTQSQWIAFSDNFSAPSLKGPGLPARAQASGRTGRFLSDDSSDAYCRAASGRDEAGACFSDIFSGLDKTAAPGKIFTGNTCNDALHLCCA